MTNPLLNLALKVAAWLVLAGVAWATLGPIGSRPHLLPGHVFWGSGDLDRVVAYFALAFIFAWAYPRHLLAVAALVVVGAVALEAFQLLTLDRHGDVSHLAVKLLGAAIGLQAGLWSRRLVPVEA